jgi:hypothetical protein
MPGSNFGAHKPLKMDKMRFGNIYSNHPKSIKNQYFGVYPIVRLEKARNHHFQCQEVILEHSNH